jgi:hypothetical protein
MADAAYMSSRELIFHKDHATTALHTASGTIGGFHCLYGNLKVVCVVKDTDVNVSELDGFKDYPYLEDLQDRFLRAHMIFSQENSKKGNAQSAHQSLVEFYREAEGGLETWDSLYNIVYYDLCPSDIL